MYREHMNPDIPKELGERLPRKDEEKKEVKPRKVSDYVVEINGKYRTVEYPTPTG
jgi:hypothetical protein